MCSERLRAIIYTTSMFLKERRNLRHPPPTAMPFSAVHAPDIHTHRRNTNPSPQIEKKIEMRKRANKNTPNLF